MGLQQQPREQPAESPVAWSVVCLAVLSVAVIIGYPYGITLWDWLKLLVVPAMIAGVGIWFNHQQRERELESAREQRQRELEIAASRTHDEALQAYLVDQMGRLLLETETQLGKSKEVRTLARAWTLTVLTRLELDGLRKRIVVQFLYEAKLITKDRNALDLRDAFLNFVNLNGANLTGVNLHGVNLTKAMMNDTKLGQADLGETMMFGANLLLAKLRGADMRRAVLMSANTDSIPLPRASVTDGGPSFESPGPKNANLMLADLRDVDLTDAYVSEEQLLSAASLAGATMPNGQKYEDWLKDWEGGKNE